MADFDPPGLRWGILGCARICRRAIIRAIGRSRHNALAAIASRDGETARAWAAEFGIPRAHASYDALIADPEIDAVYIPLPNEGHRPGTGAPPDVGKHGRFEKPRALGAAEARAMAVHCQDSGVLLREAFMWRHQPRSIALRRMVAQGVIGDLRLVRSSFSFAIAPG